MDAHCCIGLDTRWWMVVVVLANNGMLLGLDFGIQKKLLAFHCSATEAKMLVPGSQVISLVKSSLKFEEWN